MLPLDVLSKLDFDSAFVDGSLQKLFSSRTSKRFVNAREQPGFVTWVQQGLGNKLSDLCERWSWRGHSVYDIRDDT